MSFIQDFKAFALKGNVVDMAVGVIIGGACDLAAGLAEYCGRWHALCRARTRLLHSHKRKGRNEDRGPRVRLCLHGDFQRARQVHQIRRHAPGPGHGAVERVL